MSKIWSRVAKISIVALLLGGTALAIGSNYFFKTAFVRSPKNFITSKAWKKTDVLYPEHLWYVNYPHKKIWSMTSDDGLKLQAVYLPTEQPSDKTIILAHGFMGSRDDMGVWAKLYNKMGFNVLMPDARGHGKSQGQYITYGWLERKDYQDWIQKVIATNGSDSRIVLGGVSMGAATVMMTAGEKLPSQVKAIIEDCGYTDLSAEFRFQLKTMFHGFPEYPIMDLVDGIVEQKLGFHISDVSALNQIKKSRLPMMFIHGGKDTFVPSWMVHTLYDAYQGPKKLYIVKNADHGHSYKSDKKAYAKQIKAFLSTYQLVD